jgi:AcrR family transcriptional regulator
MGATDDLDLEEILEILEAMHPDDVTDPNEGLRARKKRRIRQRISDVATAMFLAHGFDNVTVAKIASACEVSEQTVFNYFPTKESMLFDRSESTTNTVADAVRERTGVPLVEAVVQAVVAGFDTRRPGNLDETRQLRLMRLFGDVATGSPVLVASRLAEFSRSTDEIAVALADRVGADPVDPEVQLAAVVIAGIVRVRQQSTFHHGRLATSTAALAEAVHDDLTRAARIAEPTLTLFDKGRDRR